MAKYRELRRVALSGLLALASLTLGFAGSARAQNALVRVSPTTTFPYNAQCKVYALFANGERNDGSGTVIGSRYVLTAGHIVYQVINGLPQYAVVVMVVPGLDDTEWAFDAGVSFNFQAHPGYVFGDDKSESPIWKKYHDIALITLPAPLQNHLGDKGRTDFMKLRDFSSDSQVPGEFSGYPDGRDDGFWEYNASRQYRYNGDFHMINASLRVWTPTLTYLPTRGMSGSGIYHYVDGVPYVFAVNVGRWGSTADGFGVHLTQDKIDWLGSLMPYDH